MKKVTIAQQLKIKKFPFIIEDSNGTQIYFENSYGTWIRREKDEKGNQTFAENSDGYWCKREFDSNGNEIYYEDSDGTIIDNRPKVSEVHITMADIKDSIYKAASADFIISIISIQRSTPLKEIELTMDEIAKALNIDVNLLKIKK